MDKLKIIFYVFTALFFFFPHTTFAQKQAADLIINNGTVITMDASKRVIENGAVAVIKNKIVAVGKSSEILGKYSAKQIINAKDKFVIPGLINTHTHIPMTLFRGIGGDLDLNDWLTKYIFPAEAKNVNDAFVRAGTKLGLAEMIRGGTTTYCDMYYFEDAVADETFKAGVRGVLGETIIQFPVADNKTPADALVYAEKYINKWKNNPLVIPAIAPHAPYTLSTEDLLKVKKLADKLNSPVIIHVAETEKEVADISKQYGARPLEYLNKIGFLSNRVIAAHTVHINEAEIDILKEKEVGAAHCPQSNMKLASGVAPISQMLIKDIPVGLGTDGAASNDDLNLWEEMDTAAKLQKVFRQDPKILPAEEVFEMATIRGARALKLEKIIGSLEAGKMADIVVVDANSLNQTPYYNVYSSLVYATKASDVRHVIINGKIIMRDKSLLTLNESAIKINANIFRQKIINSLAN